MSCPPPSLACPEGARSPAETCLAGRHLRTQIRRRSWSLSPLEGRKESGVQGHTVTPAGCSGDLAKRPGLPRNSMSIALSALSRSSSLPLVLNRSTLSMLPLLAHTADFLGKPMGEMEDSGPGRLLRASGMRMAGEDSVLRRGTLPHRTGPSRPCCRAAYSISFTTSF